MSGVQLDISAQNLPKIMAGLKLLPPEEQKNLLKLLDQWERERSKSLAHDNFMFFVRKVWPDFIGGRHHKIMAEKFEQIANGFLRRLIICLPPRHTKSEFGSYLLPAWFMGRYPKKKVIQSSHTAELAVGFGRKVRNLVDSDVYKELFPDMELRPDSKAAGRWSTSRGGEYFAIGVGGAVTGKGADLFIIDDPHDEQEGQSGDPAIFDHAYEWYTSGPRQRLQPGGAIVIICCMTGDTPVLMADGTEKPLRDIRPNDNVATYENEGITTSRVLNHRSNGVDAIYQVQTQSGRIVRANERHPFLVDEFGDRRWVKLKDLKVGMGLVSTKVATGHQKRKQNPDHARRATPRPDTTKTTLKRHTTLWGTTASGKEFSAKNVETTRPMPEGCARNATGISTRCLYILRKCIGRGGSRVAMESLRNSTQRWLQSAITAAMSVVSRLPVSTPALTGMGGSASTIAMRQMLSEGFSATTAISRLATGKPLKSSVTQQNTYNVTVDPIVRIEPYGYEEVFDVQIERTENFIANGLVSHNTRWSKRDLIGQVLKASAQRGGDDWEVIEFPAILPSGNALWPEFWPLPELEAVRNEIPMHKWLAQYQQNPTAEEGALIKREWWQIWEQPKPPKVEFLIQSWDTAFLKKERADYSACTTWGVFYHPDKNGVLQSNIILMDAFREKMEFPQLKKRARELYMHWKPEALIVEAKAAGTPLIFELRAMGIPVSEFTPSRGNDKVARVNAVSDLFSSGKIWRPNTRYAEEVAEEFASFPSGEHDDYVDSGTQALLRYRRGGFVSVPTDEQDEPKQRRRKAAYY